MVMLHALAAVLEELPRDAQGVRRFRLKWQNADQTHGWTMQQLLELHFAVPAIIVADANSDLISAIGSGAVLVLFACCCQLRSRAPADHR